MIKLFGVGLLGIATTTAAHGPEKLTPEDLEWQEIVPGAYFASAYGDWNAEGHGKFVKFEPGVQIPPHTHTGAYDAVMISGKIVNLLDEGERVELGPGDYFHMAAGRVHWHECVSEEPCFFYTHSDVKWDLELAETG